MPRGVTICERDFEGGCGPACTSNLILVPSCGGRGLVVCTREGKRLPSFAVFGMNVCYGVAVVDALAFVTTVTRGVVVLHLGSGARMWEFPTQKLAPFGIAAAEGLLYITLSGGHCVAVFREDGTHERSFGQAGEENGELWNPQGLTVRDGQVLVADSGNNRVSVFEADRGAFVRAFGTCGTGQLDSPRDVCVLGDIVFVTDNKNHRVALFALEDGSHLADLGGEGVTTSPTGLCIADDGVLYVTCQEGIVSFRA